MATKLGVMGVPETEPIIEGYIDIGGVWKNVIEIYIVQGGAFKAVSEVDIDISSTWKTV